MTHDSPNQLVDWDRGRSRFFRLRARTFHKGGNRFRLAKTTNARMSCQAIFSRIVSHTNRYVPRSRPIGLGMFTWATSFGLVHSDWSHSTLEILDGGLRGDSGVVRYEESVAGTAFKIKVMQCSMAVSRRPTGVIWKMIRGVSHTKHPRNKALDNR
jgi:hypothetical protein